MPSERRSRKGLVPIAIPAQDVVATLTPQKVERGTAPTITASGLPAGAQFRLTKTTLAPNCAIPDPSLGGTLISSPVRDGDGTITGYNFLVPDPIPLGNYIVCMSGSGAGGVWQPIRIFSDSGGMIVVNDSKNVVKVDSVHEAVNYADESGMFRFVVLGEGFS